MISKADAITTKINQPLSPKMGLKVSMMKNLQELVERDSSRDILAELDVALSQMRNGEAARETKYEVSPVCEARTAVGLSQQEFAELMGISKRTLQEWEQGRRVPTGAARTLIKVAIKHPEVLRELPAMS